jgi:hypothetical protein
VYAPSLRVAPPLPKRLSTRLSKKTRRPRVCSSDFRRSGFRHLRSGLSNWRCPERRGPPRLSPEPLLDDWQMNTDALTGLWASGQAIRPKMGVRQRHCDAPVSATTANYVGTSDDVELNATCEDREEIINVPKLASHRRAPLAM